MKLALSKSCGILTPKRRVGSPLFMCGTYAKSRPALRVSRLAILNLSHSAQEVQERAFINKTYLSFDPHILCRLELFLPANAVGSTSHKFLIFVMKVLLSGSIVSCRPLIGPMRARDLTVIDMPAMQQKFLFKLVWCRAY